MSIHAMNHVWRHSKAEQGTLLVMLAIADHADEEGMAFPSLMGLGVKSRLSVRQVRRCIGELVRLGELEVFYQQGPQRKNLFKVKLSTDPDKMSSRTKRQGDTHVPQEGDTHVRGTPMSPKSSNKTTKALKAFNRHVESSGKPAPARARRRRGKPTHDGVRQWLAQGEDYGNTGS